MLDNQVLIHFHSREANYFQLTLWSWLDQQEGQTVPFSRYDSFGAVALLAYPGPEFLPQVNLMAKDQDWSYRSHEYRVTREFGLAKTEVWLVDGDPVVYYSRQAAVASPHYGRRRASGFDMAVNPERFDWLWGFSGWLGARYGEEATSFRLWAPTAQKVELVLYESTEDQASVRQILPMTRGQVLDPDDHGQNTHGVWFARVEGDLNYQAYRYRIHYRKRTFRDSRDPYATAATGNGRRSVVINPADLVPEGFQVVHGAAASWRQANPCQALIMELHVRDFSQSTTSGIDPKHRGRYLGMIQAGTVNGYGDKTGFDYIKALGVNYIQLQPVFDHHQTLDDNGHYAYNWGYDPENYNVPDATFASQPANPANRILELKQVIQAYHEAGIGVIMDVVYNHTYSSRESAFQLTVPDYYYRMTANGAFHNGSGCGNETASEKEMFRKYMVDSILYWIREYGVDGFRFDLMGLHDVETMRTIRQAVDAIDPRILLYGEGWDIGTALPAEQKAMKANAHLLEGIGFFNDDQRDAVKGAEVYGDFKKGFVSGYPTEDTLAKSFLGSDELGSYLAPSQVLNYIEAHDNYNLNDLFWHLHPEDSERTHLKRIELANALNLAMQGMTFVQLGQEFGRTKLFPTGPGGQLTQADKERAMNSYNAPDEVNQIDWNLVTTNGPLVEQTRTLAALKTSGQVFSYDNYDQVRQQVYVSAADQGSGLLGLELRDQFDQVYRFYANASGSPVDWPAGDTDQVLVTNAGQEGQALGHLEFLLLKQ